MAEPLMKETVRIESDGFPDGVIINKEDFVDGRDVIFGTEKVAPKEPSAPSQGGVNVQVGGATPNVPKS